MSSLGLLRAVLGADQESGGKWGEEPLCSVLREQRRGSGGSGAVPAPPGAGLGALEIPEDRGCLPWAPSGLGGSCWQGKRGIPVGAGTGGLQQGWARSWGRSAAPLPPGTRRAPHSPGARLSQARGGRSGASKQQVRAGGCL